MKYYIFFTHTIYNLGGGQLLTLRKARFLKEKGYKVIIIYEIQRGPFLLKKEYSEFKTIYIPEFGKPYNLVRCKHRKKCYEKIYPLLREIDRKESIIESNDEFVSVWAEVLAKKLNVRHFIYLIAETKLRRNKYYPYYRFCKFKLERNEFLACNSQGLRLSFGELNEIYNNNFINVAFNQKEILELSDPQIEVLSKDKEGYTTITTVSRLDKPYVISLLNTIIRYCEVHPDVKIEFLIVGGTVFPDVEKHILDIVQRANCKIDNLRIFTTGFCLIGRDLFKRTDLFIGMGTAAINSISQSVVTLTYNPITNKTSGYFGIETENFGYSDRGKEFELDSKITEYLNFNEIEKKQISEKSYDFYLLNYSLESTWDKFCKIKSMKMARDLTFFDFSDSNKYILLDIVVSVVSYIKSMIYEIINRR